MLPYIHSNNESIPRDKKTIELFYGIYKKSWCERYRAFNCKAKSEDLTKIQKFVTFCAQQDSKEKKPKQENSAFASALHKRNKPVFRSSGKGKSQGTDKSDQSVCHCKGCRGKKPHKWAACFFNKNSPDFKQNLYDKERAKSTGDEEQHIIDEIYAPHIGEGRNKKSIFEMSEEEDSKGGQMIEDNHSLFLKSDCGDCNNVRQLLIVYKQELAKKGLWEPEKHLVTRESIYPFRKISRASTNNNKREKQLTISHTDFIDNKDLFSDQDTIDTASLTEYLECIND